MGNSLGDSRTPQEPAPAPCRCRDQSLPPGADQNSCQETSRPRQGPGSARCHSLAGGAVPGTRAEGQAARAAARLPWGGPSPNLRVQGTSDSG